jgi:hypothetical protein
MFKLNKVDLQYWFGSLLSIVVLFAEGGPGR